MFTSLEYSQILYWNVRVVFPMANLKIQRDQKYCYDVISICLPKEKLR